MAVSDSILKLQTQSYIFEIINQHDQTTLLTNNSSVMGELVVTSLENRMRPLLRYRTGDLVRIDCHDGGFQSLTPLGRVGNTMDFIGIDSSQDEFECLVWPEDEQSRIFNYFIALHHEDIYFVFTGDYETTAQADRHLRLLREAISGVVIYQVQKLPEITGLGSTLGWKTSRVHDLRESLDSSYPTHIKQAVEELRNFIETLNDRVSVS
ncbi:hypothetical protein D3C81_1538850 [compost metagenome]